ncbi:MAG: PCRF domain-containing protein, partial [bacterium]|nr:PCRF domain-containing protein [bacterium]
MDNRYQSVLDEYGRIQKELSSTAEPARLKHLGKKQSEMVLLVEKIQELGKLETRKLETEKLLTEKDEAIKNMAEDEIEKITAISYKLKAEIDADMLPRDPLDEKDVIIEIRAGAGGDESALFAAELFRMY